MASSYVNSQYTLEYCPGCKSERPDEGPFTRLNREPAESCSAVTSCDGCGVPFDPSVDCTCGEWEGCPGANPADWGSTEAGNQADNAAAAQALSQTIQAPPDRGSDPSRVIGSSPAAEGHTYGY